MLYGIYSGKPVHSFSISGYRFYVIRGAKFLAALRGDAVYVWAPKGISYRQAAVEADRARREGKFVSSVHHRNREGAGNDF